MIGHRATISLSLLCALLFSAFAAQSASAKGTTAFTCVAGGGAKDFSDAHCDTEVTAGTGSFGHVAIAIGTETEVATTNEKTKSATTASTSMVLKSEVALTKVEIICQVASGVATDTNEGVEGVMQIGAGPFIIQYSICTVNKPLKCAIEEPITMIASSTTRENLGAGKNEMGVEFKPVGKNLTEITFKNNGVEVCALKGITVGVEGTAIGTGGRGSTEAVTSSGATLLFTNAMTKETLKMGGKSAEFSSTITMRMAGGGNPITFTTTAT